MSPERDRVRDEIEQVAAVSRQTLHDIREAVCRYRRPTLAVETASARTALEAAQMTFEDDPALVRQPSGLESEAEAALAWCLREAVTNVVRHSGATWCRARLIYARVDGEHTVTLEVTDNGAAVPWTGTADGTARGAGGGAGIGAGPGQRFGREQGRVRALGQRPDRAAGTPRPLLRHAERRPGGAAPGFRLSATLTVD